MKKKPSVFLRVTLIFLTSVGIVLLLPMPNLTPLITKAKPVEAQIQAKAVCNAQTTHNYMYSKYSLDFNGLNFVAPKAVKENGRANYRYELIRADNASFKVRAEAATNFDGDGVLNVWEVEIDEQSNKPIIKD